MAICIWFSIQQQFFILPPIILLLLPLTIMQNMIGNWIHIRLLGGKWKESILSSLAARSLVYTRNKAFYKAWLSKNLAWQRTDKFKVTSSFRRAFYSSKEEIISALIYIGIAAILSLFASFRHPDIIFLIWLGVVNQTVSFLCAPIMAFLSEKELKEAQPSPIFDLESETNAS